MAKTEFKPLDMLTRFKVAIEANNISFVDKDEEKILDSLKKLIKEFEDAIGTKKEEVDRLIEMEDGEEDAEKKRKLNAERKKKEKKGLSDYLDSYEVHKKGQRLWQELMSAALRDIDRHPKGNSELFNYVDAATKFEDMLYGFESYYRDHTLHSLWVYLIGVLLIGEGGQFSHKNMNSGKSKGKSKSKANKKYCDADNLNWYLCNDIELLKKRYQYPEILVEWSKFRNDCFHAQVQKHRDAIWCIMALCHDLGYSLAKLTGLNEKVLKVLKFYHIADFKQVGYSLDIEHQYLIKQFIELMAIDVRIVPGEDYEDVDKNVEVDESDISVVDEQNSSDKKEKKIDPDAFKKTVKMAQDKVLKKLKTCSKDELDNFKFWNEFEANTGEMPIKRARRIEEQMLVKCYRDDTTYWRLCKALETKEHGILSAYLLFKTLGTFADTYLRGVGEEWGLEDEEVIYNVIRGDILFGIAQHEFAYAHIDQLGSLDEILILCDELEEFTRLGRQLQSRKYHDTAAETRVEISDSKSSGNLGGATLAGKWIDIKMTYKAKHDKRDDFKKFFARKCEKLCKLYSLGQIHDEGDTLYNPIGGVTAIFEWDDPDEPDNPTITHIFEMKEKTLYGELGETEYKCKKEEKEKCEDEEGCPVLKDSGRKHEMECMDDKIMIKTNCIQEVTLRKWLDVKEDE